MAGDKDLDYLNEGLDGRTEYRFYWDRDVLAVWFYVGSSRKRKTTSVARSEALTPAFRAEARARAHEIVNEARHGRVLQASELERVQVASTAAELRDAWVKLQEKLYPDSWKTRRTQINNVVSFFESAGGEQTPLQRMVDDRGPQAFVNARMRERDKETVIKEVGILFQFLSWLHEEKRFIADVPKRPKYRPKDLGTRVGPQRAEPVHLDDEVALRIIERLPEYAARGGRKGGKLPEKAFVCRDMMRFAFETGLRPSTVFRLRVTLHWIRGSNVLRIAANIDKGRNVKQRGKVRIVPMTAVAQAILEKRAPESGLIFGKHDLRVQWKRAAIAELGEEEGSRCAPYDLRHGANFRMRSTVQGSVGGAMHMVGQSKASTNDIYMRGTEKAALEMVALLDARNDELVRKAVRKPRGRRRADHESA